MVLLLYNELGYYYGIIKQWYYYYCMVLLYIELTYHYGIIRVFMPGWQSWHGGEMFLLSSMLTNA